MKYNKTCFLFIFVIIFVIFVGTVHAEPYGSLVKELSPKASFSIDHTGEKEVVFPGTTGKLKIPARSLNKRVNIEVQRVEISYNKKRFNRLGDVYRFGPHGLKFKKPVLLTLPYTEPEFPEEFVHIYYYNVSKSRWDVMETIEQDKDNNTITAEITHFSDYVPGVGSYSIEEGISPNSSFFKRHNEYVDKYRGNLIITRTDVYIPGRGVDLVVKTGFNSDGYFWNYKDTNNWAIVSEIEDKAKYKIAKGWRFNFSAIHYGESEFGDDTFIYMTEEGQVYNLTSAITGFKSLQEYIMYYVGGYRIYNESHEETEYYINYERVIELVRAKMVITCDVEYDKATEEHEI